MNSDFFSRVAFLAFSIIPFKNLIFDGIVYLIGTFWNYSHVQFHSLGPSSSIIFSLRDLDFSPSVHFRIEYQSCCHTYHYRISSYLRLSI